MSTKNNLERADWLKQMRSQAEALYDHLAPAYWTTFGFYDNEAHRQFIQKFLERLAPQSSLLDAGCGAGRYDGLLLEKGHRVLGIDQSAAMLARAREHFPQEGFPELRYAQIGLQEMEFQAEFDGAICVDAMEHVCPEDWPDILKRFHRALKPGGVLYLTVEAPDWEEVRASYEKSRAQGLPVVFGEVVDELDDAYTQVAAQEDSAILGGQADRSVYHYHPSAEQVRTWLDQAGLSVEEEGAGNWYSHLLIGMAGEHGNERTGPSV